MKQAFSNLLLCLFLVNTFGYGLLELGHTLMHYFPSENEFVNSHIHKHEGLSELEHAQLHLLANHQLSDSEDNPQNGNSDFALLIIDFLNYPLIKPDPLFYSCLGIFGDRNKCTNISALFDQCSLALITPPPREV